jgi:energy-coupling factor transporter ATP-binding protein EcfA2
MNKLRIKSFKVFKNEIEINLNSKNFLLYGENGAGKSSIFEALKVIFFKNDLIQPIQSASTPEEQAQIDQDFWSNYNNKTSPLNFDIELNDINYDIFPIANYQVFMVALDDLIVSDRMNLNSLLDKLHLQIDNIEVFCSNKHSEIQQKVNDALVSFKEDVQIEIDKEENYAIKIIDASKNLESKAEIRKYFNEAKLNLITLLLLFNSIEYAQIEARKKVLILDDFITSMDASNRTFLMKYIMDNFSDFQILIFTHNVSFYNLIMFLVNEIYKNSANWVFAALYEINNASKLYTKNSIVKVSAIRGEYNNLPNPASTQQIDDIGNKIRQKFEILLYEFSKLIMIGAVEDSNNIINRIEGSKNLYYKNSNTASDLIDEISRILAENNPNNLANRINNKISEYNQTNFSSLKQIIGELKLYRKVTMHPMSHGTIGQSSFTTNEIEKSMDLLEKLEKYLKDLVDNNVSVI